MTNPSDTIDGRSIRIALVGCGRISINHIKAIALHHERAELVALCDTQQERLDNAQQIVSDVAQEHPSAAQNPKEFIGYEKLLTLTLTVSAQWPLGTGVAGASSGSCAGCGNCGVT